MKKQIKFTKSKGRLVEPILKDYCSSFRKGVQTSVITSFLERKVLIEDEQDGRITSTKR